MAVDFLVCIPLLVLFGVFVEDFFAGFVVFFCFFGFLFPVFFGVLFEFAAFVAPFSFFGVLSRVFVRLFLAFGGFFFVGVLVGGTCLAVWPRLLLARVDIVAICSFFLGVYFSVPNRDDMHAVCLILLGLKAKGPVRLRIDQQDRGICELNILGPKLGVETYVCLTTFYLPRVVVVDHPTLTSLVNTYMLLYIISTKGRVSGNSVIGRPIHDRIMLYTTVTPDWSHLRKVLIET